MSSQKKPRNAGARRLARRAVGGLRDGLKGRLKRRRGEDHGPPSVDFGGGRGGAVERGETVLAAARRFDVDLDHFCGGTCSCGTCRVRVLSGGECLSPLEGHEEAVLGVAQDRGDRLACQAQVLGPVVVSIPDFFGG